LFKNTLLLEAEFVRARTQIVVRKATAEDAASILNVLRSTNLQGDEWTRNEEWVKKALDMFLKTDDYRVFVAEIDDKIVGLVGFVVFPSLWEGSAQGLINDFFVDKRFQGKGAGTKLLEALVEWADTEGIEELHVSTGWENEAARRLYEKFGFTKKRLLLER